MPIFSPKVKASFARKKAVFEYSKKYIQKNFPQWPDVGLRGSSGDFCL